MNLEVKIVKVLDLFGARLLKHLPWIIMASFLIIPLSALSQSVQEVVDFINITQSKMEKKIRSYTCHVTNISQKLTKTGKIKSTDTTYFMVTYEHEQQKWIPVDKNGELISADKDRQLSKSKAGKKQNSKANFSPFDCFSPEQRGNYNFKLLGHEDQGATLKLQIIPLRKDDKLIQGTVWVDAESYVVRRMSFGPAKNPKFVKLLVMKIDFAPVQEGIWLPKHIEVEGRGKILLFKFQFRSEQFYRDYKVVFN